MPRIIDYHPSGKLVHDAATGRLNHNAASGKLVYKGRRPFVVRNLFGVPALAGKSNKRMKTVSYSYGRPTETTFAWTDNCALYTVQLYDVEFAPTPHAGTGAGQPWYEETARAPSGTLTLAAWSDLDDPAQPWGYNAGLLLQSAPQSPITVARPQDLDTVCPGGIRSLANAGGAQRETLWSKATHDASADGYEVTETVEDGTWTHPDDGKFGDISTTWTPSLTGGPVTLEREIELL